MGLEHLWAGWRTSYVTTAAEAGPGSDECVFCRVLASDRPDDETHVVWRGDVSAAVLNAYPYTSGHLMVMPVRHVAEIEDLDDAERAELWRGVTEAVVALKAAYHPEGVNLGANLGRSAGAGIPGHFHVHVLPRWSGDTNFMTTVANARVLPEALSASDNRVRAAWPNTNLRQ